MAEKKFEYKYENPSRRSKRFSEDLKHGRNERGYPLTDTGKAFRSGYLLSQKDNCECFKKANPDYVSRHKK